MVAPDNDPANLKGVYDKYDDRTGVAVPKTSHNVAGVRHMRQADYEALASTDIQGDVVYVTTGASGA